MRIVNVRLGFQADHSSSSYLFYAVERPASAEGQRIAHRYSSRADVDARRARYQKWGESGLSYEAFGALLGAHYDVMASESYDWWTFRIALPKNGRTKALLGPFSDARGDDDLGVDVEDYGKRLGVVIHCRLDAGASLLGTGYDDDPFENLVELLVAVRRELLGGDVSFLHAVADYYGAGLDEDDDERDDDEKDDEGDDEDDDGAGRGDLGAFGRRTKEELRRECERRGVVTRASWTKAEILGALAKHAASKKAAAAGKGAAAKGAASARAGAASKAGAAAKGVSKKGEAPSTGRRAMAAPSGRAGGAGPERRPPRLSVAARKLLDSMDNP